MALSTRLTDTGLGVRTDIDALEVTDAAQTSQLAHIPSPYAGKKANFKGDSITYGSYTYDGESSPDGRVDNRYCDLVGAALGMALVRNYSASGISISGTSSVNPSLSITNTYSAMDDDADLIFIAGGTNDYGTSVVLGAIADTTDVSFYGALHVLCNGLMTKYVGKKIMFMTPIHRTTEYANSAGFTLAQYRQAIFDVASGKFGLTVIDGFTLGFTTKNTAFKDAYINDGLHPNVAGHALLAINLAPKINADDSTSQLTVPIDGVYPTTLTGLLAGDGSKTGSATAAQVEDAPITDAGGYFATNKVGFALQQTGAKGSVVSDTTVNAAFIAGTWTADPDTDVLTCSAAHGLVVGNPVSFGTGTGALPAGIAAEPEFYYVVAADATTIQISLTRGGAALNITDAGTAGWQIRLAWVDAPLISLDFALYQEIDLYGVMEWCPRASSGAAYPMVLAYPNTTRVFINDPASYGQTPGAIMSSATTSKKYVKLPCHINLRKIETALYNMQIDIAGLFSDNLNFSSSTVYARVFSGIVTAQDITGIRVTEGYEQKIKNGSRFIVIRR